MASRTQIRQRCTNRMHVVERERHRDVGHRIERERQRERRRIVGSWVRPRIPLPDWYVSGLPHAPLPRGQYPSGLCITRYSSIVGSRIVLNSSRADSRATSRGEAGPNKTRRNPTNSAILCSVAFMTRVFYARVIRDSTNGRMVSDLYILVLAVSRFAKRSASRMSNCRVRRDSDMVFEFL